MAKRLATRGPAAFDLDQFERFEATRKELQAAVQQAQASRNRIAKDIGQAKARGQDVAELMQQGEKLKALLEESEKQLERLQAGFQDLLARIPNIPHESVPIGKSSEDNPERRRWGRRGIFLSLQRTMSMSARASAGSTSLPRPRSRAAASS